MMIMMQRFILKLTRSSESIFFKNYSSRASSTVFALSSGHGRCGVAVVRVSGPLSSQAVKCLCGRTTLPIPRLASLQRLIDPSSGEIIDRGLVLWFPGPASFTGEDCVEFHVHGGTAVVSAILDALGSLPGLQHAAPGDFARRAFLNGKMDLTAVEGLGDLINAETSAQRRQAVRQMEGDLGHVYSDWRKRILKCLANVEAFIDFDEEENIEDDALDRATEEVEKVGKEIQQHLADNRRGERLREGVHVAIIGAPNVGKSSLLNALCRRPAAIVSPIAGTTRDVVETAINLAGYPVLLSDTAGLRETNDIVEREGVKRALDRAQKADLRIVMMDAVNVICTKSTGSSWSDYMLDHVAGLGITPLNSDQTDQSLLNTDCVNVKDCKEGDASLLLPALNPHHKQEARTWLDLSSAVSGNHILNNMVVVINKSDLLLEKERKLLPSAEAVGVSICVLSCSTMEGLDSFITVLANRVKEMCGDPLADSPTLTQARHRSHLRMCHQYLSSYLSEVCSQDTVLAAEALRRALRELGFITGAVSVEDVLDVIFKDFCIGK